MTLANPVIPTRFVVTDLYADTLTWLGRNNLLSADAEINLDAPSSIAINVRANDPAINTLYTVGEVADGDPLLAQSNRLVYMLMRLGHALPWTPEYLAANPWQCVASGIAMSPQDQGTPDTATTTMTVWDAWQLLNGIPCFLDEIGTYILSDPAQFTTTGNVVAFLTMQRAISSMTALGLMGPLAPSLTIDLPPEYGGTAYYTGTNDTTPFLDYSVQQGTSVGAQGSVEAFAQLTLNLQKQGKRTFTVDPDPIRAGIPILDYYIGDRVPVLAPAGLDSSSVGIPGAPSLRVMAGGFQRVQTIPLHVDSDGLATVEQLQVCPDWPGDNVNVADLTPTSGAAGTSCTAVCSSFHGNAVLEVYVGSVSATVTAGGSTDPSGATTITCTLPSWAAGVYTLYVTDGESPTVANSQFTVT